MALEAGQTDLITRLRERQPEIEEAIFARVSRMDEPTVGHDVEYEAGLRAAVTAVVGYGLSGLASDAATVAAAPPAAITQAHRAAQKGISVETVLTRYIAGHRILGEFVVEEVARTGLSSNAAALCQLRTTQEDLLERLTTTIASEYRDERERLQRRPDHHTSELVHRLLAGERPDTSELDYELDDAWHLGVIADGLRANQVVGTLAATLRRQLLTVSTGRQSLWAWIGASRDLDASSVDRALAQAATGDVALVLGQPRFGTAGWRLTHQEAQAGLLVALRKPQPVTRFSDDALLAIVLQDESLARALTDIYLPSLSIPVARETLRAYFASGWNKATAAAKLGITRHTVDRRLRAIEAKLDRRLETCHAELEIALRLEELGDNGPLARSPAPANRRRESSPG